MTDFHKVKIIEERGFGNPRSEVYFDGNAVKGVVDYNYSSSVDGQKVLELKLLVDEVQIELVPKGSFD